MINIFTDFFLVETTSLSYLLFALVVFTGIKRRHLIILTPQRSAKTLLRAMDDLVFLTDSRFHIIDVNEAVLRFLNCDKGVAVGTRPDQLLGIPEAAIASNRTSTDLQSVRPGKNPAWLRITASKIDSVNGTDAGHVILVRDITLDRLREEELKKSLAEREELLREVHHRVNNSLQIIISLLRLKRDKLGEGIEAVTINEAIERIMVISHLYQQLYASENFSAINLEQMIHEIAGQITSFTAGENVDIIIHSDEGVPLIPLQNAVPLGLILLELIENACRHAYPDGATGQVNVSLKPMTDKSLKILIADDGIGFTASDNHTSGGLAIAGSLTQQIQGELEKLSSNTGTVWELFLPSVELGEPCD